MLTILSMIARISGGGGLDMGMHLASNANDNVDDGVHDDVGVHDDFDDIDDIMMVDDAADDDDDDDDDGDVNDMEVMMSRQMSTICRGCLMWYFTQLPLKMFVDDIDVVVDAVVVDVS